MFSSTLTHEPRPNTSFRAQFNLMTCKYRVYRMRPLRPARQSRARTQIMAVLGSLRLPPVGQALSGVIPAQIRDFHPSLAFSACAFLLVAALLLGGATRGGFLSDTILEL